MAPLTCEVLIDGERSHHRWIEIALAYIPNEVLGETASNLAIVSLGSIGACRLPDQYRQRELVLISDWMFPPAGDSEGDDTGRFFIVSVLHEIAHAICRHKSPLLDELAPEESRAQEDEADALAIRWFNQCVQRHGNEHMKPIERDEFRTLVDRYAKLSDYLEECKVRWHRDRGT